MIRIYTADQRFETERGNVNVVHTLNQGVHYQPSRKAIGSMHVVNEWSGLGNSLIQIDCKASSSAIILPIQERLFIHLQAKEYIVEVGEVALVDVSELEYIQVVPQVDNDQYYVFGEYQFVEQILESEAVMIKALPLQEHNRLTAVFNFGNVDFEMYIGAFVGKEAYKLSYNKSYLHTFVQVWNGTFEVEERLLFEGDSLALADYAGIEIEHLADRGIVTILNYGK